MINIALIGCGYWGSKLYRYLKENKNFNLKYVYAPSGKNYEEYTNKLADIWYDKNVSAVVIATPIDTHYQLVKQALLHRKHVLVEKPLTLKTKECLYLKRLAEKLNLLLLTEYTWTFSKALKQAQLINIGTIKALEMEVKHLGRFMKWDVYWLLASHMLSILDMFVPLVSLRFDKINLFNDRGLTETGIIVFQDKTVKGTINISLNYTEKTTKVIIYGTKGTIIYDPLVKKSLRIGWYKKVPKLVHGELLTKTKIYTYDEMNNLKHAVEYFHQALIGKVSTNTNLALKITTILEKLGS